MLPNMLPGSYPVGRMICHWVDTARIDSTAPTPGIRTHSVEAPMLSASATRYPVIVMKSGIGAFAADYTTFAESLATAGYIVVGADAPYSTFVVLFPDGRAVTRSADGHPSEYGPRSQIDRLIAVWSQDARFVLDKP